MGVELSRRSDGPRLLPMRILSESPAAPPVVYQRPELDGKLEPRTVAWGDSLVAMMKRIVKTDIRPWLVPRATQGIRREIPAMIRAVKAGCVARIVTIGTVRVQSRKTPCNGCDASANRSPVQRKSLGGRPPSNSDGVASRCRTSRCRTAGMSEHLVPSVLVARSVGDRES